MGCEDGYPTAADLGVTGLTDTDLVAMADVLHLPEPGQSCRLSPEDDLQHGRQLLGGHGLLLVVCQRQLR